MIDLSAAWGIPGVQDTARSLLGDAEASWGIPGVLSALVPQNVKPAPAPVTVAPTPIANTTKADAQPEPSFMERNGRMVAIVGGIVLVVVVLFTFLRRK